MSWFYPKPPDLPLRLPRQLPKRVVPSFILEDGQVLNHLWHHGVGTRARDYSGQGNHGTLVGPTWLDGPWGWCLEFDGNDVVNMVTATPNWDTAITVETWLNHPKDGILRKVMRSPGRWVLHKDVADGISFGIGVLGVLQYVWILTAEWPANTWIYMVGTIKATTNGGDGILRIYLNNVLIRTAGPYAGALSASSPRWIGANDATSQFWNGLLAFPRIYNRVLTAAERTKHFEEVRTIFGV